MSYQVPDCKAGVLLKQSRGSRLIKNWRKRFVRLEAGKLSYFVSSRLQNGITIGVDLKGELILENAKVFKGSGTERKFMKRNADKQLYVVAGTDELNLFLEATSATEAAAWIQALEEHAKFATKHPNMVPKPERIFNLSESAAATQSLAFDERPSRIQLDNSTPEDYRFNNSVLKTMVTPSMHGILLKTRDESTNTAVFLSIVSHPLCHDTTTTVIFNKSSTQQPITLINPRNWHFMSTSKRNRHTATKLGLREYCEPSLVTDGEPYVVLQESQSEINFTTTRPHTLLVDPSMSNFQVLRKIYQSITSELSSSHQISCHKQFAIIIFKEQDHIPLFVSPMEIIVGRNNNSKDILFFTTLENIQRYTETLTPVCGVQLNIHGQGLVPPNTVRGDITIIIKLNSHAVCDKMRDNHLSSTVCTDLNSISSTQLKAESQRDLGHALDECTKAVFLLGEGMHHTDSGHQYYTYDVTTNTTIIRLCKLDQFVQNRKHQHGNRLPSDICTDSDNDDDDSAPSRTFRGCTNKGPSVIDVVTMYVLQSITRYYGVKMSGYTSTMSSLEAGENKASPDGVRMLPNPIEEVKPVKVVKFSTETRQASSIFSKNEKFVRNDYDSFIDPEIDSQEKLNRMSISNVYSCNSFSLSHGDVVYTDTELYSCKLKELTCQGSNILDHLEDDLAAENSILFDVAPRETAIHRHQCVSYIISAELPTYVLDYPMLPRRAKTNADAGGLCISAPAVLAKVRQGDKVCVYCIKEYSDDSNWMLIDAGWIPADSCRFNENIITESQLPRQVFLSQKVNSCEWVDNSDTAILIECTFDASRSKGKSVPLRRHFKSCSSEGNPFTYDKSSDSYDSVSSILVRREVTVLDDLVRELLPGARSFDKADTVGVLHNLQDILNLALTNPDFDGSREHLREFFTPTKEDMVITERLLIRVTT